MARIITDIVDVYVFRRQVSGLEALQVRRSRDPGAGSWHPVMGHVQPGETSVHAAERELREELGLCVSSPDVVGWWQLEGVHPFYLAARDVIMMCPRFAAEVAIAWAAPETGAEHRGARWAPVDLSGHWCVWPGQAEAWRELARWFWNPSPAAQEGERVLRLPRSAT